ncbi:MAG: LysR family transcriptional regulator, partial [Bacteroidota bacterium]
MSISPPRPKGPPLNALRAFEASARLGGFARAAEELFVSP